MKYNVILVFTLLMVSSLIPNILWASEQNRKSSFPGTLSIQLDVGKINNTITNSNDSFGRVHTGHIKQSNIIGNVKLDNIHVGDIKNELLNTHNSSSEVKIGAIKGSTVNNAKINVDIKNVDNKVTDGNNNHAIVKIGSIQNSLVRGQVNIDIKTTHPIINSVASGNGNRSEVSIGSIEEDGKDLGQSSDSFDNFATGFNNTGGASVYNAVLVEPDISSTGAVDTNNAVGNSTTSKETDEGRLGKWFRLYSENPYFNNYIGLINRKDRAKEIKKLVKLIDVRLEAIQSNSGFIERSRVMKELFYNYQAKRNGLSFKRTRPSGAYVLGTGSGLGLLSTGTALAGYYVGTAKLIEILYDAKGRAELFKDLKKMKKLKQDLELSITNLKKINPKTLSIDALIDRPNGMSKIHQLVQDTFGKVGATNKALIKAAIAAQTKAFMASKPFVKVVGKAISKSQGIKSVGNKIDNKLLLKEMNFLSARNTFEVLKNLNIIKDSKVFRMPDNKGVGIHVRLKNGAWASMKMESVPEIKFMRLGSGTKWGLDQAKVLK